MKFDETMLSGYIDGELSDEERKVVEKRIAENPKDRELLRSLTELHKKLSAMPEAIFRQDPIPAVRARIAAERANPGSMNLSKDSTPESPGHSAQRPNSQISSPTDKLTGPNTTVSKSSNHSNSILWWSLLAMAASTVLIVGLISQRKLGTLADNVFLTESPPAELPAAAAPATTAPGTSSSRSIRTEARIEAANVAAEPASGVMTKQANVPIHANAADSADAELPMEEAGQAFSADTSNADISRADISRADTSRADTSVATSANRPPSAPGGAGEALSRPADSRTLRGVVALPKTINAPPAEMPTRLFAIGTTTNIQSSEEQQAGEPDVFGAPVAPVFDPTQSVTIDVPQQATDEALRLINQFFVPAEPISAEQQTDFEAVSSDLVAVLVQAAPEQVEELLLVLQDRFAQPADRAQPIRGVNVESGLREGRIWIVLRPR